MVVEGVRPAAFLVQGLATVMISFLSTLIGFVNAWPSYTLENFRSNETVLSVPMTSLEISLLGSLPNIGGLVATPLCGYALNKIGRKYTAMLFGVPFVISWTTISLTNYVPLILTAVGFAGIGAAGQVLTTVYIAEISHDSIRGALTSMMATGYFIGILLSYVWGGCLSFYTVVYIHLGLSILYIIMIMFLKESPVFLIQKGKEKEAARSLAFYRRVEVTSREVELEIKKIKLQIKPTARQDNDVKASEALIESKSKDEAVKLVSAWQFLLKSESSKRALLTCILIMIIKTFMGAITLQVYAEPLFKMAVPTMKPYHCTIFMAIDNVLASSTCSLLMDRLGRKFLMTIGSIGSGICTLLLATQLLFNWASGLFTAAIIFSFAFIYIVGANTVIFVVAAEVFLPEVRGFCNSIIMIVMWAANFAALVIFIPIVDNFGLHSAFFGFSVVCFSGALYSHYCLPETKGLAVDAIQGLFVKDKRKIGLYVSRLFHSTKAEEVVEYVRVKTNITLRVMKLESRHNMNFRSEDGEADDLHGGELLAEGCYVSSLSGNDTGHPNDAQYTSQLQPSLGSFVMGSLNVWPSYTAPQFTAENTTLLSTPMSDSDVALLGSLPSLGAMIGTGVVGLIIDRIGRKMGGLAVCIPFVLSWAIIEVTSSSMLILAARFLSGVSGGAFLAYSPIFISEVADTSIRGALASFPMIAYGLGILFSYIMGWFLTYHTIIWLNIVVTVLECLLLLSVKESPTYLVRQRRDEDARNSLAAYIGVPASSMVVTEELAALKAQLMPATELVSVTDSVIKSEDNEKEKLNLENIEDMKVPKQVKMSPIKMLFLEPASRQAFTVIGVIITMQVFMGIVPVQVYAKTVFKEADPANADLFSVIFALVLVIGCGVTAGVADLAGRRILVIISSILVAVCMVVLGLQLQMDFAPKWITVAMIMVYCFCFMFGAATIPYVLLAEIFNPDVQSIASMIIVEWVWFLNFVIIAIFPFFIKLLGMHGTFYMFAGFALLNAAISYIIVPETKGLTNLQIQDLLQRRKS